MMTAPRLWSLAVALMVAPLSACWYEDPVPPAAKDAGTGNDAGVDAGVDPCTNACDPNATCEVVNGAAQCACNTGYAGDGHACADVDECALGTDNCAAEATCTNTVGGFTCTCSAGYEDNGSGSCVDVDECAKGTDNCADDATCTNTTGSYTCACNTGFSGDGVTCTNVDECANGTAVCPTHSTCSDTQGSYTCLCNTGFMDNGSGACVDIDECATPSANNCDANATCTNTVGAFTCACNIGYSGNGTSCANIDECATGTATCTTNTICTDTPGSFMCTCKLGYVDNGSGACVDVDECAANTDTCDANATCTNVPGTYTCACNTGYSGDGLACANINECAAPTSPCGANATCADAPGSFTCTCNTGYADNGTGACVDVDECATNTDNCSNDAICTNTAGNFTCACNPGFTGDGVTCTNVDECATGVAVCGANSVCTDTPGGYTCPCAAGYGLQGAACVRLGYVQVTSAVATSQGVGHSCAISQDGSLWCWGANSNSQLGDGSQNLRTAPAQVGSDRDWARVAAGESHTCAVKTNGTLWCWGAGTSGRLGQGSGDVNRKASPVQVGTDTNWSKVTAGTHTCAIKTDGTLWCWGDNLKGQLGNGTIGSTAWTATPTRIGTDSDWVKISAGPWNTCGYRADHVLRCWGDNTKGQIGQGSTTPANLTVPTAVGTSTGWTTVTVGRYHVCGTQQDGTLWCWGDNVSGQLGNGTTTMATAPTAVAGTSWTNVEAGNGITCGTQTGGILWCWGANSSGQAGDGVATTGSKTTPVQVVSTNPTWNLLSVGTTSVCATDPQGTVYCWGDNGSGQLGDRSAQRAVPTLVSGYNAMGALTLAGGASHTAVVNADGTLWTWGRNVNGQLGINSTLAQKNAPTQVTTPAGTWLGAGAGSLQGCGIMADRTLQCWGVLLMGTKTSPQKIGTDTNWSKIGLGQSHQCMIKTDGTLWCAGKNSFGNFGNNATNATQVDIPVQEATLATNWASVYGGQWHTCGLKTNGALFCWGQDTYGQVGDGATTTVKMPVEILAGTIWNAVGLGFNHTCAIKNDGSLWCWGSNSNGQLGAGTVGTNELLPLQVSPGTQWTAVAGGFAHTCAVKSNGTLWCWGAADVGQTGTGNLVDVSTPTQVGVDSDWARLFAGGNHTCAVKAATGAMWCWGLGANGQLGIGDGPAFRATPGVIWQ